MENGATRSEEFGCLARVWADLVLKNEGLKEWEKMWARALGFRIRGFMKTESPEVETRKV